MKKINEIKDLREKDILVLTKELSDLKKKYSELKFKSAFGTVKKFHEIAEIRHKIARIWTIIAEKTISNIVNKKV